MHPRYPRTGAPLFDLALFRRVVRSVRQERQQTVREAAKDSGVSAATITRIETSEAIGPDVETFLRLCAWTGCDPGDFARSDANGTPPIQEVQEC